MDARKRPEGTIKAAVICSLMNITYDFHETRSRVGALPADVKRTKRTPDRLFRRKYRGGRSSSFSLCSATVSTPFFRSSATVSYRYLAGVASPTGARE